MMMLFLRAGVVFPAVLADALTNHDGAVDEADEDRYAEPDG